MVKAKKFVLVKHFEGEPKESDLKLEEEDLSPVKDGEFLCRAEWLSIDPYMRPYSAILPLGSVMIGGQVAKVVESKNPKFPAGSHVVGYYGWRTHTIVAEKEGPLHALNSDSTYLLPDMKGIPVSVGLGAAGMTGATAYFGLLDLCQPKAGEVVVVSTAAGAVGSMVGQIAKIKGCTVIGYTGTDEKVKWLKELGFDHALNYKKVDLHSSLKEAAPNGVDCYFDNVGGTFSSTVLMHMNLFGRIAVCGAISTYNDLSDCPSMAPAVQGIMIQKQLRMEGFVVSRWADRYKEAVKQLLTWIQEGKLKYRETIYEGFESMPQHFFKLLKGDNTGKAVVKV